jgi:fatty-acid peroxygenase
VFPPVIPRDSAFDSTLALLSEGYGFIGRRCRRLRSDAFRTRIMLRWVVCALGADAAEMFYQPGRFTRKGALPFTTVKVLHDRGSAQMLDGTAHRARKEMLLSVMSPAAAAQLGDLLIQEWSARLPGWERAGEVVLLDQVQEMLCAAVCAWAGIPLHATELERRTRELSAMVGAAGHVGPRNWRAILLRRRTERWARRLIARSRAGELPAVDGAALPAIARYRDENGELLTPEAAAVELINVLRPTVAVAWFILFIALALHDHPEWRERLRTGQDADLELFVHEVRRFYPMLPMIGGRALQPFEWRGWRFGPGDWVILDLYGTDHDPRIWGDPESFRPERFRTWSGSAYDFVPNGGGDHRTGHRCPGEWITIELMKRAAHLLSARMTYDMPPQDLRIDLGRIPTAPRSGLVLRHVRRSGERLRLVRQPAA